MSCNVTKRSGIITDMRERMKDILLALSWQYIARTYFSKSSSWLYHKMDGIDGNGGVGGFSPQERLQFKEALEDLSIRIKKCADSI